jgi:hypothetical protein
MAVTASGLFVATFLDVFDASQEPVNLVGDTIKCALFTNSITPNFSSDTAYAASPYNANEVSGTGYSAGGATLGSKTFTESPTGSLMFDAADVSWTGATFSSARCALIWDDTPTTPVADPALCLVNFGADYGVTSGTLTVTWNALGIAAIDITP